MKPVLISIQRPHTDNIKTLIKNIEVRKGRPNQDTPFPCYIYETKAKGGCGKVIGEFVCDKIEKFVVGSLACDDVEQKACISYREICDYFYGKNYDNTVRIGYGWHISNLKIYEKPKELSEFLCKCNKKYCTGCEDFCDEGQTSFRMCGGLKVVTRPPQSWSYVEELEEEK